MSYNALSKAASSAPRCARRAHAHDTCMPLKRHASTKFKAAERLSPLPPHKMRALVTLYHKADTFITPEGLDSAIDATFTADRQGVYRNLGRDMSLRELWAEVDRRRLLPKDVSATEQGKDRGSSLRDKLFQLRRGWSEHAGSAREFRVTAALFGVSEGSVNPGYEVLKDKKEQVLQALDQRQSADTSHIKQSTGTQKT
ncbi:hypothetical protein PUNSTDRAFT_119601 [Punctularia strigosozonata HHB-11173 SS5]|uniref:uncharacterized protein n=1 Tax=Punctularia strigosozonata (strain HHB-11173) TaxID=741275 RepID=UPI0004418491|nr:uncharacterized protein PUNSTDRAFT_119601 [Punctularia strigosozonata HHB-11173 SS5]EIN10693.1 hypothetical protein PUNSTDRAFT_119601 [Punctularia strigosozonata HHB-11173 SS5]